MRKSRMTVVRASSRQQAAVSKAGKLPLMVRGQIKASVTATRVTATRKSTQYEAR
jgi:hypothetical protein